LINEQRELASRALKDGVDFWVLEERQEYQREAQG
jgi:hypothetical protein